MEWESSTALPETIYSNAASGQFLEKEALTNTLTNKGRHGLLTKNSITRSLLSVPDCNMNSNTSAQVTNSIMAIERSGEINNMLRNIDYPQSDYRFSSNAATHVDEETGYTCSLSLKVATTPESGKEQTFPSRQNSAGAKDRIRAAKVLSFKPVKALDNEEHQKLMAEQLLGDAQSTLVHAVGKVDGFLDGRNANETTDRKMINGECFDSNLNAILSRDAARDSSKEVNSSSCRRNISAETLPCKYQRASNHGNTVDPGQLLKGESGHIFNLQLEGRKNTSSEIRKTITFSSMDKNVCQSSPKLGEGICSTGIPYMHAAQNTRSQIPATPTGLSLNLPPARVQSADTNQNLMPSVLAESLERKLHKPGENRELASAHSRAFHDSGKAERPSQPRPESSLKIAPVPSTQHPALFAPGERGSVSCFNTDNNKEIDSNKKTFVPTLTLFHKKAIVISTPSSVGVETTRSSSSASTSSFICNNGTTIQRLHHQQQQQHHHQHHKSAAGSTASPPQIFKFTTPLSKAIPSKASSRNVTKSVTASPSCFTFGVVKKPTPLSSLTSTPPRTAEACSVPTTATLVGHGFKHSPPVDGNFKMPSAALPSLANSNFPNLLRSLPPRNTATTTTTAVVVAANRSRKEGPSEVLSRQTSVSNTDNRLLNKLTVPRGSPEAIEVGIQILSRTLVPTKMVRISQKVSKGIHGDAAEADPESDMDTSDSSTTSLVAGSFPGLGVLPSSAPTPTPSDLRASLSTVSTMNSEESTYPQQHHHQQQPQLPSHDTYVSVSSDMLELNQSSSSSSSTSSSSSPTTLFHTSSVLLSSPQVPPSTSSSLPGVVTANTTAIAEAKTTSSSTPRSMCLISSSLASSSSSSSSSPTTTASPTTSPSGMDTGRRLRVRNQRKFLPEKKRHKRQTLQDMTRPLKQWLYKHRDNPYPSKSEKVELVKVSDMSLTQVSNWFANARRRLKNTVKGDDVSWAKRIRAYNKFAEGNAERFSIPSSEDEAWDSEDEIAGESQERTEPIRCLCTTPSPAPTLTSSLSDTALVSPVTIQSMIASPNGTTRESPALEDNTGGYHKYKHSILQRYLQDASQQALIPDDDVLASRSRHRHLSSSTGSHDFEYLSTSSVSSPSHEAHHDTFDDFSEEFESIVIKRRILENPSVSNNDEMYWKEIGAALALTSLARSHINK